MIDLHARQTSGDQNAEEGNKVERLQYDWEWSFSSNISHAVNKLTAQQEQLEPWVPCRHEEAFPFHTPLSPIIRWDFPLFDVRYPEALILPS